MTFGSIELISDKLLLQTLYLKSLKIKIKPKETKIKIMLSAQKVKFSLVCLEVLPQVQYAAHLVLYWRVKLFWYFNMACSLCQVFLPKLWSLTADLMVETTRLPFYRKERDQKQILALMPLPKVSEAEINTTARIVEEQSLCFIFKCAGKINNLTGFFRNWQTRRSAKGQFEAETR